MTEPTKEQIEAAAKALYEHCLLNESESSCSVLAEAALRAALAVAPARPLRPSEDDILCAIGTFDNAAKKGRDEREIMRQVLSTFLRTSDAIDGRPAPAEEGWNLEAHLTHQREWSRATFGPGARTAGVIDHIRKELAEIEADPLDIKEWVDVIILAFDGAWRSGWEPKDIIAAIRAKQAKNEARIWPDWRTMPHDKAIEHDRSHDTRAPAPAEGWRLVPLKLLEEAHAVMRACGWQLAPGSETQSDGVLEAAAAEIEDRFRELLALPAAPSPETSNG